MGKSSLKTKFELWFQCPASPIVSETLQRTRFR